LDILEYHNIALPKYQKQWEINKYSIIFSKMETSQEIGTTRVRAEREAVGCSCGRLELVMAGIDIQERRRLGDACALNDIRLHVESSGIRVAAEKNSTAT
jgi:hypothetical protein